MKAPDLALTQLVVETITTILFIVSFSRLPNVARKAPNMMKETIKIIISLIVAGSVMMLILSHKMEKASVQSLSIILMLIN